MGYSVLFSFLFRPPNILRCYMSALLFQIKSEAVRYDSLADFFVIYKARLLFILGITTPSHP